MKGDIMTIRKLLILACGLALAIAALAPASAPAKAKNTNGPSKAALAPASVAKGEGTGRPRPFMGMGSSVGPFCRATGVGSADLSGVATHVGKYTGHADVQVTEFIPPGTFISVGTFTLVAANGDEVTGTLEDEADIKPDLSGHLATIVLTVEGGTGRFADASGTVTVVQDGTILFRDESACPPFGESYDLNMETLTGWVSY
jgi:hypothetical protein